LLALKILEGFDLRKLGHNTPDYLHLLVEALKLAFADRHRYIADPRFSPEMPVSRLLSGEYAASRRSLIRMDRAIKGVAPPGDPVRMSAVLEGHSVSYVEPSSRPAPAKPAGGSDQTSSFAIADRFGNVVSVTHSVNGEFGSGMVVDGAGFVLSNRSAYF